MIASDFLAYLLLVHFNQTTRQSESERVSVSRERRESYSLKFTLLLFLSHHKSWRAHGTQTNEKTMTSPNPFASIKLTVPKTAATSDFSFSSPPEAQTTMWRLAAADSFSDWTLEIKRSGSGRIDTYHVHRFFLALGPRASQYFASLLQSSNAFTEGQAHTSRIPLEDSVADSVPDLLDYMYHPTGVVRIDTKNASEYCIVLYSGISFIIQP